MQDRALVGWDGVADAFSAGCGRRSDDLSTANFRTKAGCCRRAIFWLEPGVDVLASRESYIHVKHRAQPKINSRQRKMDGQTQHGLRTMTRTRAFQAIVAISGCLLISPQQAHAAFCQGYKQTWSNAGHCTDCRLKISGEPKARKYVVESSNGWKAELRDLGGQSLIVEGRGRWNNSLPHVYSGQPFRIVLARKDSDLLMRMTAMTNGRRNIIKAVFRCTDSGQSA